MVPLDARVATALMLGLFVVRAGRGDLLIVGLVGVLWGLNWPTVKFLLTEIEPLTLRALAFPSAAVILAVAAWLNGQRLLLPRSEIWPVAITGLFLVFGFNALTSLGQVLVETSKAAIIAYTMPPITAILSVIWLRERLSMAVVLALGLSLVGLGILASENLDSLIEEPLGPVIMLAAALSWAIGNVSLKARAWALAPLALTVWFFIFATLVIWPLVLIFETPSEQIIPSPPVIAAFAYHVLGPMVVCYLLWTRLLERLPATTAAIAVLTAPIAGVLSSLLLLGDQATWQKMTALALIVSSIAMTLIKTPKSDASA